MSKVILAVACVMAMAAIAIASLFAPRAAHAQGFVDEPTCYSWEGGHKSAGSFSKCSQPWVVAKAPAPPPAPVVVPAPVMQSTVCPPQIILEPEPKKAPIKRKPRPAPLKC